MVSILKKDVTFYFGDPSDGSIQIPAITQDGGVIEVSSFYGKTRPKTIIVLSSQVGCPLKCQFCELGEDNYQRNLTYDEMFDQFRLMHQELERLLPVAGPSFEKKIKITIANTGEPLLNPAVIELLTAMSHRYFFPTYKVSTLLPKGRVAWENFKKLAELAANRIQFSTFQPQISLLSSSEQERFSLSKNCAAPFATIQKAGKYWKDVNPKGRKVNLSLILISGKSYDAKELADHFSPELFRIRLRPYVETKNGRNHALAPFDDTSYQKLKGQLLAKGFEVEDWALPSTIERKFGLASNITRRRYLEMINGN